MGHRSGGIWPTMPRVLFFSSWFSLTASFLLFLFLIMLIYAEENRSQFMIISFSLLSHVLFPFAAIFLVPLSHTLSRLYSSQTDVNVNLIQHILYTWLFSLLSITSLNCISKFCFFIRVCPKTKIKAFTFMFMTIITFHIEICYREMFY